MNTETMQDDPPEEPPREKPDDRIPTPATTSRDGQARPRDRVREAAGRQAVRQWVKRSSDTK